MNTENIFHRLAKTIKDTWKNLSGCFSKAKFMQKHFRNHIRKEEFINEVITPK